MVHNTYPSLNKLSQEICENWEKLLITFCSDIFKCHFPMEYNGIVKHTSTFRRFGLMRSGLINCHLLQMIFKETGSKARIYAIGFQKIKTVSAFTEQIIKISNCQ